MPETLKRIRDLLAVTDPTGLSLPLDATSLGSAETKRIVADDLFSWIAGQLDIPVVSGSSGYVQFNTSSALDSDSKFFWDKTNHRLGINTVSPGVDLDVRGRILSDRTAVTTLSNPNQYFLSITNFNTDGGVGYAEVSFGVATDGGLIQTLGGVDLWLNRTGNAVRSGGNFVPTVTNSLDLGTTAIRWNNAYIATLTLSNALSIANGGTGQTTANAALNALLPTQTGNNGKVLGTDGSNTSWVSAGGAGTVTSVDLSMPAIFSVSGNPVTAAGTLAVSLATQVANKVWAGPTTGSAAAPTFRYLVAADIPDLSGIYALASVNGTVTNVSVTTANGVSGSVANSTTTPAITIVLGAITPTSVAASGTISGSNLNAFTTFTGPTTSVKTFTLPDATCTILTTNAAVTIGQGGTGQTTAAAAFDALSPMTTLGDLIYGGTSGANTRLAGQTTANFKALTQTGTGSASAAPGWNVVVATVTAASAAVTVSTTSTTGAVTVDLNLANANTWTAAQTFQAGTSGSAPIIAKANASGSVSPFQIQKSDGTVYVQCDSNGYFFPDEITFCLAVGTAAVAGTTLTCKAIAPQAGKIVKAWANANTGPTGADLIFDINLNGTSIWASTQANRIKITAGSTTGNQTSFDTTTFVAGDLFSIDIDQIGSTIAGQDITVMLSVLLRNN